MPTDVSWFPTSETACLLPLLSRVQRRQQLELSLRQQLLSAQGALKDSQGSVARLESLVGAT